jgi:transposase
MRGLSDGQWEVIEPILRPKRRSDGRGRPWQDTRAVLNGILWVLGTGAQDILRVLAEELQARGKLQLEEAFIDASFTGAKKGASRSGPPSHGKGPKIIALAYDHSLPLAATKDGRPLRCYRRRWRVERLFAWLHHFRRLVIRWEYHVENCFGMVRPGCIQILLRQL